MILGVDIDLHRITIASSTGSVAETGMDLRQALLVFRVLLRKAVVVSVGVEVAGPVVYAPGPVQRKRQAWALFNMAAAERMVAVASRETAVRVAPSNRWTLGYKEDERHRLYGVDGLFMDRSKKRDRHDLREACCMARVLRDRPDLWMSWDDYLDAL